MVSMLENEIRAFEKDLDDIEIELNEIEEYIKTIKEDNLYFCGIYIPKLLHNKFMIEFVEKRVRLKQQREIYKQLLTLKYAKLIIYQE